MSTTPHDLVIIGSGPAGYTAALYAARAELRPLVFEGTQSGGSLMTTTEVENFPGFPNGVTGSDLMQKMREQARHFGADLRTEDVDQVELQGSVKKLTANGRTYSAHAVILAMGAAPRYLNIPGEMEFLGRGVSSCATCDGFFFKDRDVAVIGGGDSTMEEATFLTRFANSVTIVHRRDRFRASAIMLERAKSNEKIRFRTNAEVVEVHGGSGVTHLTLAERAQDALSTLEVSGMFVAIGHDPRSELVAGQVDLDDNGYVVVRPDTSITSLPGVFAAGDLVDHSYRQAITAAGAGCRAALDAQRWLAERGPDSDNSNHRNTRES
ncbi:thioredoxin-disulfide reductase [Nocardia cyriacigeorgica]|uniref:Thioredoxin reductase n=1 Tax=Nocardia cyriacigeorgica TaxID=135487 RepID=A0A4U8VWA5_9NOCA|nr:thioredoxin-disulfide reductase [Nocardia cyriacigeorgica]VFA97791.1 Thioredoxin reductase [Nocardia cyriacigeorgica]